MDSGGPFAEGGMPDEQGDSGDDLPLRGWLPPDDRLWLHPSEMARNADSGPTSNPTAAPELPASPGRHRPGSLPVNDPGVHGRSAGIVSIAAVVVAVAMVVLMADRLTVVNRSSPALTVDTTSLTTALTPTAQLQATMADVRSSLIGLVVTRRGHRQVETGVAMEPGNLIVTAVSAVSGATGVVALTPQGRRLRASVLASDTTSGVSVLRVRARLDPARFATTQEQIGDLAMTECLCQSYSTSGGAAPDILKPTAVLARVDAVGVGGTGTGTGTGTGNRASSIDDARTAPAAGTGLLDAIEADYSPLTPDAWGGVLVNGEGQVVGILDSRTRTGGHRLDVFVPGWLADQVADRLSTDHRVDHGWLGVTGSSTPGACGAVVKSIVPGAPAQHSLRPGDVIVDVDGRPVCTWSELQASLYVTAPDQVVDLAVDGSGGQHNVPVRLSPSPS